MNLRQRGSRYGFGVHFIAGAAGVFIMAAGIREGFDPSLEIWLAAGFVVVVILHARLGFAYNRVQSELEVMRGLVKRVSKDPAVDAKQKLPTLAIQSDGDLEEHHVEMLGKVKEAIEAGRVDLYLQPIVSLPQRKHRFYEAYSRLRLENGGILKPSDYLESAERANRIGVIDNMILLRCIQALREKSMDDPRLTVFCNLSPATLFDNEFFAHFADYLEANKDLSSKIVFEFTYPAIKMMHERVEKNLRSIASKGFVFSVDHVQTFDLDFDDLRDKSFAFMKVSSGLLLAANNGNDVQAAKLAHFRRGLADAGIDLIVEKIEYEDDMPAIAAMGIDYGQGNLFGAPRAAPRYLNDGEQSVENSAIYSKVS